MTGTAILYSGRKAWTDRLYGSGLYFLPGQTRKVPHLLARKLLRHADLFSTGIADIVEVETNDPGEDDTAELMACARKAETDQRDQQSRVNDVLNQIDQMDKDGLAEFAQVNYRQPLDKRRSLDALREQVRSFIDQFGVI